MCSQTRKPNITDLPDEICRHIYLFAYSEELPEKLCSQPACWRVPACAECNSEVWAQRFLTADIQAEELIDAEKRMWDKVVASGLLRHLREDESLTAFLKKCSMSEAENSSCADYDHDHDYANDYANDDDDDRCQACGADYGGPVCRACRNTF